MINEVILITQSFPYKPGEEFLETEVNYYKYYKNIKFIILPMSIKPDKREVDTRVYIDNILINEIKKFKYNKYLNFIKNLSNHMFYKEILNNGFKMFSLETLKAFNESITRYNIYYSVFNFYFKNQVDLENKVLYTYWNNEVTYALQSLKKIYKYKLISRVHGGDLYKERKYNHYMPLKKQFTNNIDNIFTITEKANLYLNKVYGFDNKIVKLSRLGVKDKNIITKKSNNNILHLVSCSFLNENKKIDKIIKALKIIAEYNREIYFKWSHIGGGELYNSLEQMAYKELSFIENISFEFKGTLENYQVYEFYKLENIDVFVNVSISEGVPVSIMEAMSCRIPIIAPNIGGISDMIIDHYNGLLLSSECNISELVIALNNVEFFKNKDIRNNSYNVFLEKYNAKKNYIEFLNFILEVK